MKKVFLFAMTVLMMTACGPYKADQNKSPLQETERVVLLDRVLASNLNIVKQMTETLESGQMRVKLEIENEKNDDLWTDIQVIFKDSDGFEMEKISWQPVRFQRRAVTTFQRNSMKPNASDYRILIRNAN